MKLAGCQLVGELPPGNGTDQSGSGQEAMKRPAAVFPGRAFDADDSRRLIGRERDVEAIQWMVKAVTERLDKGFLARPALKESQRLVARVEGEVRLIFAAGKKTWFDVVGLAGHTNRFSVPSHPAARCLRGPRDILWDPYGVA